MCFRIVKVISAASRVILKVITKVIRGHGGHSEVIMEVTVVLTEVFIRSLLRLLGRSLRRCL